MEENQKSLRPKSLRENFESVFLGIGFVAVGTIIASSVYAQNKSVAPAQTSASSAACAPAEKPDAMCTVALKTGPEAKICFGDHHPNCYELKDDHLVQIANGGAIFNHKVDLAQKADVKKSIETYSAWLETELTKLPKKPTLCREVVTVESKLKRNEFCLSALPKKETDAKTKALLSSLETPGFKSK